MRTILLGLFAASITLPAQAQVQSPGGIIVDNSPKLDNSYGASDAFIGGSIETPTMRRQKLAWAVALREEVLVLQARDGGTLSDQHAREIERKWNAIRSHSHAGPGALAPIRD